MGWHIEQCVLNFAFGGEHLIMFEVQHVPENSLLSADGGSRSKGQHFPYEQEIKFFAKVQYTVFLVFASMFAYKTYC